MDWKIIYAHIFQSCLNQPTEIDYARCLTFSAYFTHRVFEKNFTFFLQFAAALWSAARDEYSYTAGHFPTTIHSPLPAKGESILLNFYWKKSNLFKPPCSWVIHPLHSRFRNQNWKHIHAKSFVWYSFFAISKASYLFLPHSPLHPELKRGQITSKQRSNPMHTVHKEKICLSILWIHRHTTNNVADTEWERTYREIDR